jgi:hypothetical protein
MWASPSRDFGVPVLSAEFGVQGGDDAETAGDDDGSGSTDPPVQRSYRLLYPRRYQFASGDRNSSS